jgi:TetR/AcrR family transcriptional repressor of nem operon
MANETTHRPRLTPKGERTRARIVEKAAALMHERGVAGTTLEDVKVAADVSGSQLYHFFPDKGELVQAVVDYQAVVVVSNQRRANLGSSKGLEAWRNMVIAAATPAEARGGCALGSLGGQLAEIDPTSRTRIASGFDEWSKALSDGLRSLHGSGQFPSHIDPDDLATTLLATLQGGLLLAQVERDTRPLETAIDTLLALAIGPT